MNIIEKKSKMDLSNGIPLALVYGFVEYRNRWGYKTKEKRFAIKCKLCDHVCTQYHVSKISAKIELTKRGHSESMCNYWKSTQ